MIKRFYLISVTCFVLTWASVFVAPVLALDVYAEGAYTDTDLQVYLYADITPGDVPPLVSYGVKMTYSSNLTVTNAEKNEKIWYMGDGTTSGNKAYMNPDTSNAGEIIFIGGKLDTANPTAGVSGNRVLLGKAVFSRIDTTPVSITLELGRDGNYANFVGNDKTPLDGDVVFKCTLGERGDANLDGSVTPADMIAIKNAFYGGAPLIAPTIIADCNGDGSITPADMICIKNKFYSK